MASGIGDVLSGRYELLELLGRGGMAEVFRARDLRLDRDVAVKVLAAHLLQDPAAAGQLQREARATASFSHPGLVGIHDVGSDDDTHFIVLELIEGPTLADVLRSGGPMGVDRAVRVVIAVADAVQAAHAVGVIHRDLKPSNVLFDSDERVRVTDFGIAHAAAGTTSATSTAMLAGSVPYLAPEQAYGDAPTPAVDVYALGCLLFEVLTGRPPFERDTPAAILAAHLHQDPPAPSSLRPEVPASVDAVVHRALVKDPSQRYPDAGTLAAALRRATDPQGTSGAATVELPDAEQTVVVEPGSAKERAGGWRAVAGIAALVAVLALVAIWATDPGDDESDPAATSSPVTQPTTASPPSSPSPSPSASPSPSPSPTSSPTPETPEEAATAMRDRLRDAVRSFEIQEDDAEDLDDRLAEIIEKHREGKPQDVDKKLRELRRRIDEYAREDAIGEDLRADLQAALDRLEATL